MNLRHSTAKILSFFTDRLHQRVEGKVNGSNTPSAPAFAPCENRGKDYERNEKRERGHNMNGAQSPKEEPNSFNSFNSYTGHSSIQWPEPLSDEAYYGLAGEIVRTIEPHSEANPVAILGQLLAGFGNIIGRAAYFQVEADKHYTNLFITLVGATSKGRKGVSWGHTERLLVETDPTWKSRIKSGLSSGEGLIWAVRDATERQEPIRAGGKATGKIVEYQKLTSDMGELDKRLLVMESEFASTLRVMGRQGSTLSPVIRDAWDSGNLSILTKNSPAISTDAHISIVAHVTRDELRRYLDRTEEGNGFANRFLWVCANRSKKLPRGGNLNSELMAPLVGRLREAVEFARNVVEMTRAEETWSLWESVYSDLSEGKPGLLGAVTSRAEAQVTRLSCIYALLDKSTVVKKVHLSAALALWKYAEDSARFIFGSALGDPVADTILTALRHQPEGLTRTDISKLYMHNKNATEIDRALTFLQNQGLARFAPQKTEGRPAERWFAV